MVTTPPDRPMPFDIREQIARIDKTQAELQKLLAETSKASQQSTLAIWQVFAMVFAGGVAFMTVGAVAARLLG